MCSASNNHENFSRLSLTDLNIQNHMTCSIESELHDILDKITNVKQHTIETANPANLTVTDGKIIQNLEYYSNGCLNSLESSLHVPKLDLLRMHSEIFDIELSSCDHSEYTPETIQNILHSFFTTQLTESLLLRQMYASRWHKWSHYSSMLENYQVDYTNLLSSLAKQYNDYYQRSTRLYNISTNNFPIKADDVICYLDHTVTRLNLSSKIESYIKLLAWSPAVYCEEYLYPESFANRRMSIVHNEEKDRQTLANNLTLSERIHDTSFYSNKYESESFVSSPFTSDIHNNPQDTSYIQNSYHVNDSLPYNSLSEELFSPHLKALLSSFDIHVPLLTQSSKLNSQEIFYHVQRNFKNLFRQQTQAMTFQLYNKTNTNAKINSFKSKNYNPNRNIYLKSTLPSLHYIWPSKSSLELYVYQQLYGQNRIDELLKCQSQSLRVHQLDKAKIIMKQHESMVRTPLNTKDTSSSLFWRSLYGGYNSEHTLHSSDSHTQLQDTYLESGPTPLTQNEESQIMSSEDCSTNRFRAKSSKNDAYSAFLMLRHLKLRELRCKCLTFLNYFRSIEQDVLLKAQCCATNCNTDDNIYKSYGTTRAKHLFPTEADYLIHILESNADLVVHSSDLYSESAGQITVSDLYGYRIIYQTALTDLDTLENDLILIGSHFVLNNLATKIDSVANNTMPDRYAIMLDLWTLHVKFLNTKRILLDLYYEAFQQAISINDRHKLAEIILSIIWQRPIIDLEDNYFKNSYIADIECLKKHSLLIQTILNSLIIDTNIYPQTNDALNVTHRININHSIQITEKIDFLQCIPILAKIHLIYSTIQDTIQNLINIYKPNSTLQEVMFSTRLYSLAVIDWNNLKLDTGYSRTIQTSLFETTIFNYSSYITEFYKSLISDITDQNPQEGYKQLVTTSCKLLELLSLHNRLTLSCQETCFLTRAYHSLASLLKLEKSHAFLRYSPMETAGKISLEDAKFNCFLTDVATKVDRIMPSNITYAVNELDDGFAKFSFISAESIRKLLENQEDREQLITTLKVQIVNKNVFVTCCQLLFISFRAIHSQPNTAQLDKGAVLNELQKYFLSAQFMKTHARQSLFLSYSKEISTSKPKQAKMKAINDYCQVLNLICKEYVIKTQIIKCYTELDEVMKGVHSIFSNLFVTKNNRTFQAPDDTQSSSKSTINLSIGSDHRESMVVSSDGTKVVNLWYIPDINEVLFLTDMKHDSLITFLEISSNLAFILHYLLITAVMSKDSLRAWMPHRAQVLFLDSDIEQSLSNQIIDFRDSLKASSLNDDITLVCTYLKQYSQSIFLKHYITLKYFARPIFLKNERQIASRTCKQISPLLNRMCTNSNLTNIAAHNQYRFVNELEVAQLFPYAYLMSSNSSTLSGLPLALKPSPAFLAYFSLGEFRFEDRMYIMAELVSLSLNCIDDSTASINNTPSKSNSNVSAESIKFLNLLYLFNLLREDWIAKMLKIEQITSLQEIIISEELTEMYIRTVAIQNLNKVKKSNVNLGNTSEQKISLLFEQIKLIARSLYYHLMVECINYVNTHLSLLVANRGLFEEKVPLEVWMKPSTREMSIQTPALVNDFMTSFLQHSTSADDDSNYVISKDQFNKLIANLGESTMNRERFLYKNYSSFYEDQLKTQSLQLKQKNEEINQLTFTLENIKRDFNTELSVGIALSANEILLENLQLKVRLYELNKQLMHINTNIRIKVKQEYDQLVQSLLQTIFSIKEKYEAYRSTIYEKILAIIYSIRSVTTDNLEKMVDRVNHDIPLAQFSKNLKNTQLHVILLENSNLTKQLAQLQSSSQWNTDVLKLEFTRKMEALDQLKEETDFQIIRLQHQHDEFISQHDNQLQIIMKETATLKENLQISEKECLQTRKELKALQENYSVAHSSSKIINSLSTTKDLSQMATVHSLLNHVKVKDNEIEKIKIDSKSKISLMEARNKQISKDVTRLSSQLTKEHQEKHEAYNYLQRLTESKLDNIKPAH